MTLRTKLLSMTVLLSVVPLAIITFVLLGQSHAALEKTAHMTESGLHDTTDAAKEALIESELKHLRQIAGDLYTMCAAQQSLLVKKLHSDLAVATRVLSDAGAVTFAEETVSWTAKNQYTKDTKKIELPKLLVGDTWTGNVTDASAHVPIVDEVQELVGGTCTVFQRMNESGDMLRVATNVITDAGTRAVGTYIPAKHPNGKRNAVVAKLLSGETFFGRAYVVNAWYITAYQPILDTDGKVAGALYVGVKEQSTDSIRDAVLATKAGKSGYAFVINAKGQTRGHYVISKNGASDGVDIWDVEDSDGRLFVQDMCETAVDLRPGEIAETRYPWANAGEQPRDKITMYAYFEPWDWLIGVGAYEDEFYEPVRAMEERAAATLAQSREVMEHAESTVTKWGFVLGGLTLVASVLISLFVVRGITNPINRIISSLTEGARQVTDAAGQVSKTSQQLAEGASEQASSLEETSSALEQMAAMTRTNAENAKQANTLSAQARDAAQSGDQTMKRLNGAMDAINDSSGEISKIIKVIEEIAFQTNLLALNAAVEAARAGEHGKGFAVVAEEVRNLAQRAAQAAGETTTLIEQSVGRAKEGGDVARDVAEALGAIVGDVARVSELIEGIAKASEEQAQGVEQVNTAVGQMDAVTQSNAAGAEESASAAEELSAQASTVNGVVSELAAIVGGTATRQEQTPATGPSSRSAPRAKPTTGRSMPQSQQYERRSSGDSSASNARDFSDF